VEEAVSRIVLQKDPPAVSPLKAKVSKREKELSDLQVQQQAQQQA
jgi:hypothetical protein